MGTYFFTVILRDRQASTLIDWVDALRQAVNGVRQARPFRIEAWVVLPKHLHAVWTLPPEDSDYAVRLAIVAVQLLIDTLVKSDQRGRFAETKEGEGVGRNPPLACLK